MSEPDFAARARDWLAGLKWNPMPPSTPTPPIRVEVAEDIVQDLAAALRVQYVAGLERAAVVVRERCGACGGTGVADWWPEQRASREMALDAGDPTLEGSLVRAEEVHECEYCGRPAGAVRAEIGRLEAGGG